MSDFLEFTPYGFSMVNLVKMMPEWDWYHFAQIMVRAGTSRVELVPGMLLGSDWDQHLETSPKCAAAIERIKDSFTITSIQSLTFGLSINLSELLSTNDDAVRRFRSLARLGDLTGCNIFVLGSPAQKKLKRPDADISECKSHFTANCAWMASLLGIHRILSLEHNTLRQGAEFSNTLGDIVDIIRSLKLAGIANVGLNLDTKCLIDEFGIGFSLCELAEEYELRAHLTSIQVSLDFLERTGHMARSDEALLLQLARDRSCPISLEEFGLLDSQLNQFISFWQSANRIHSPS